MTETSSPTKAAPQNAAEVFFSTFIADQQPTPENAAQAGAFCRQHGLDIFKHVHGLVHSSDQNNHKQAAMIMHKTGITVPILCTKVPSRKPEMICEKIKSYFGPNQAIDTNHFTHFKNAYCN